MKQTCSCGAKLNVREELAGRKIRCPKCSALMVVPVPGPPINPVLVEAIRRFYAEGGSSEAAALKAFREIGAAILDSTLLIAIRPPKPVRRRAVVQREAAAQMLTIETDDGRRAPAAFTDMQQVRARSPTAAAVAKPARELLGWIIDGRHDVLVINPGGQWLEITPEQATSIITGVYAEEDHDAPPGDFGDSVVERDERVYPRMFGRFLDGIYTLDQSGSLEHWLDSPHAEATGIDPSWTSMGVMVSPPSEKHAGWTYVTSGLNPWISNPGESGCGIEFAVHAPSEENWPILLLHNLMAYVLVCVKPFGHGHRFPLNAPIDGGASLLRHVFFLRTAEFALPAGKVELLTAVGATDQEIQFARSASTAELAAKLKQHGVGVMTDPARKSVPF